MDKKKNNGKMSIKVNSAPYKLAKKKIKNSNKNYCRWVPIFSRPPISNVRPGPEVIKLLSCSFFYLTEHKFSTAYKQIKKFLALSLSDVVFIMLINVKMPTISRINFVLS